MAGGDVKGVAANFALFAALFFFLFGCYSLVSFANSILDSRAVVSDSQFPGRFLDYLYSRFNFLYAGLVGAAGLFAVALLSQRNMLLRLFFGSISVAGALLIVYKEPVLVIADSEKIDEWVALFSEDYLHGAIPGWYWWMSSLTVPVILLFGWGALLVLSPRRPGLLSKKRGKWKITYNALLALCVCTALAMDILSPPVGVFVLVVLFSIFLLVSGAEWAFSIQTPPASLFGRWGRFIAAAAVAVYFFYIIGGTLLTQLAEDISP